MNYRDAVFEGHIRDMLIEHGELGVNAIAKELSNRLGERIPPTTLQTWLSKQTAFEKTIAKKWRLPQEEEWPLWGDETEKTKELIEWEADPVANLGAILKDIKHFKELIDVLTRKVRYLQTISERAIKNVRH